MGAIGGGGLNKKSEKHCILFLLGGARSKNTEAKDRN